MDSDTLRLLLIGTPDALDDVVAALSASMMAWLALFEDGDG